jgi:RNA polymerase sigma-70 factor (ECF subfamily)
VDAGSLTPAATDAASQRWLDGLRADGPRRERCVAELHALLLRAARHETYLRRSWLHGAGDAELDDLAHQAAADALVAITDKLDTYLGASRFTTWAYKFVMFQVSTKMRRHLWSGRRVAFDDIDWERLPGRLIAPPHRRSESRAQLELLRRGIDELLTARQRDVFVAAALNDVPIDVIALRTNSTRGAIYKTLHDARRKLRDALAEAGHPIDEQDARS